MARDDAAYQRERRARIKAEKEQAARNPDDPVDPALAVESHPDGLDGIKGDDASGVKVKRGKASKPRQEISVDGWASILSMAHLLLASIAKSPELELDDEEAKKLAKASANVMRHYDVPMISPQAADWLLLGDCLRTVYGPRLAAIGLRKAAQKSTRNQTANNEQKPIPEPIPQSSQDFGGFAGFSGLPS